MNILSLFDGMSCGQIAINKLNIPYNNYFASEIDKYAIETTKKSWGSIPIKVAKKKLETFTLKIQGRTFDKAKGIPPTNL